VAIFVYHPVTTELKLLKERIDWTIDALEALALNFVVIYPNNDPGTVVILEAFRRIRNNPRFRLLPSMRFEYFLTLLKNAVPEEVSRKNRTGGKGRPGDIVCEP